MQYIQNLKPVPPASHSTPLVRYKVRLDRTPPLNELFHCCLVDAKQQAHLHSFVATSNDITFYGPVLDELTTVLLSPSSIPWTIKHLDVEIIPSHHENIPLIVATNEYTDNTANTNRITRFVTYNRGDIITDCMFVKLPTLDIGEIEASRLRTLTEYSKRKMDTMKYLLGMLAVGSVSCQELYGSSNALAFVAGGLLGILYQFLLHYEMDRVGTKQILVNTATRLSAIAGLAIWFMTQNDSAAVKTDHFMIASSAFLLQKIALWLAFII